MREVVLLDANTIWHCRFAEALAEEVRVTIVNPRSGWILSFRSTQCRGIPIKTATLPRGWGSSSAFLGQRILAGLVERLGRGLSSPPVVMLMSPSYAPLAVLLAGRFPLISYTADDYRSYAGWGWSSILNRERALYRCSDLSFFVSETLRDRAVEEFGLDYNRTAVSPNATEPRFAERGSETPYALKGRTAPIVGVLGGLSDRLDLDALAQAVASPAIPTFLVAGPVSTDILRRYPIFCTEKVVISGHIPHEEMHLYAATMDVAVIPYERTELNRHCSPIRFYDHLATGVPIIALEGCDQIDRSVERGVTVVRREDFVSAIEAVIAKGLSSPRQPPPDCFWQSRARMAVTAIEKTLDGPLVRINAL